MVSESTGVSWSRKGCFFLWLTFFMFRSVLILPGFLALCRSRLCLFWVSELLKEMCFWGTAVRHDWERWEPTKQVPSQIQISVFYYSFIIADTQGCSLDFCSEHTVIFFLPWPIENSFEFSVSCVWMLINSFECLNGQMKSFCGDAQQWCIFRMASASQLKWKSCAIVQVINRNTAWFKKNLCFNHNTDWVNLWMNVWKFCHKRWRILKLF